MRQREVENRPLLQRPGEEQVFTKDELRERRAKFNSQRKDKAANKYKSAQEKAAELKAQLILGVATLLVGGRTPRRSSSYSQLCLARTSSRGHVLRKSEIIIDVARRAAGCGGKRSTRPRLGQHAIVRHGIAVGGAHSAPCHGGDLGREEGTAEGTG